MGGDRLGSGHGSQNLARTDRYRAQIHRDRILTIFGASADTQEGRTGATGHGIGIVAHDAAFEQNASEQQSGQCVRIDAFFAEVALTHLGNNLSFLEQVIQPLALHNGEPLPTARFL